METITTLVVLIEHSKEVVIGAELEEIKIIIKKRKRMILQLFMTKNKIAVIIAPLPLQAIHPLTMKMEIKRFIHITQKK